MLSNYLDILAYIGPGLSGGVISVILGVLASIGLALMAVVWYPIKRMLKKKKKPTATSTVQALAETTEASTEPEEAKEKA